MSILVYAAGLALMWDTRWPSRIAGGLFCAVGVMNAGGPTYEYWPWQLGMLALAVVLIGFVRPRWVHRPRPSPTEPCPECGRPNSVDTRICPRCGRRTDGNSPTP